MTSITVDPAGRHERGVIENLLQLYTHDFSELWAGRARGDLQPDGRFPDYPLDPYFEPRSTQAPFLIRTSGRLAGFALVNQANHSGMPTDWSVAEFFVVRKHRRAGVGRTAARLLFEPRRGVWEVAIARRNVAALAFWRGVIDGWPMVANVEHLDVRSHRWEGPILRFERV